MKQPNSLNLGGLCFAWAIFVGASVGCWSSRPDDVVVYAALDREFSEPILSAEATASGLHVLPVYDLESTKTLGLVARIEAESGSPQCDLFWNNEILHTLRLKEAGLLRPLNIPDSTLEQYPEQFRDVDKTWIGIAARARVIIVNTRLMPDRSQWPTKVADLGDASRPEPRALAKPLFGTTATHMTVLHERWGDDEFRDFLKRLSQTTTVVSGNKQVATGVAAGEFAWGMTDTDDAIIELEQGGEVAIIYPDQDSVGALLIPNTLACPMNSPHSANADRLLASLLRPEIETRLADGPSAQIPLHQSVRDQSRLFANESEQPRWMNVPWEQVSRRWPQTKELLTGWLHDLGVP